jgi:hypothetical protein
MTKEVWDHYKRMRKHKIFKGIDLTKNNFIDAPDADCTGCDSLKTKLDTALKQLSQVTKALNQIEVKIEASRLGYLQAGKLYAKQPLWKMKKAWLDKINTAKFGKYTPDIVSFAAWVTTDEKSSIDNSGLRTYQKEYVNG